MAVCVIVVASFVTFAVEQAKSASGHQREQITGTPVTASTSSTSSSAPVSEHPGAFHEALDEASRELTSPFSSLVSNSSSEWAARGFKMLAALLVYGFGLGYLARTLRVRV
jgi:hypothetical protein